MHRGDHRRLAVVREHERVVLHVRVDDVEPAGLAPGDRDRVLHVARDVARVPGGPQAPLDGRDVLVRARRSRRRATSATWWPRRWSSSPSAATTRSVPAYVGGGTGSIGGATRRIRSGSGSLIAPPGSATDADVPIATIPSPRRGGVPIGTTNQHCVLVSWPSPGTGAGRQATRRRAAAASSPPLARRTGWPRAPRPAWARWSARPGRPARSTATGSPTVTRISAGLLPRAESGPWSGRDDVEQQQVGARGGRGRQRQDRDGRAARAPRRP